MKVLHFVKTAEGAAWAVLQVRELVKLGVVVGVVVPAGSKVQQYKNAGAVVFEDDTSLSIKHFWKNFKKFSKIRTIVSNFKPDIIHSHFVANTISLRIALGRTHPVKRIFQVPGPLHLEHYFFRKLDLLSAGPRDYWIGACEWTRNCYLENGVPPSKVGLVYYGLDLKSRFDYEVGKLRTEFDISTQLYIVGNVSYFYPPKWYLGQKVGLKGHEDLINAMKIVAKRVPNVVLVLVGGPWGGADWYYKKVQALAKNIDSFRIIFTGFRNDVHTIYKDFDVAVHPSHSENLGGAVESLLHCVPTITTDVGGFPDLVKNGATGWLVPPQSSNNLADAIIESISDRSTAVRYAKSGRDLVFKLLDVRNNAFDMFMYYQNVIDFDGFSK